MRKWWVPVGIVLLVIVVELLVRGCTPPVMSSAQVWSETAPATLRPDLSGRVGLAPLITDKTGRRRGFSSRAQLESELRVLAVGGEFTAGLGLADHELYTARLERSLRAEAHKPDAQVLSVVARGSLLGRIALVRQLVDQLDPRVLILEIDAESCAAAGWYPWLETADTPSWLPFGKSGSAVVDAIRVRGARARLEAREARVQRLVELHGLFSRADINHKEWTTAILRLPVRPPRDAGDDDRAGRETLRHLAEDQYGVSRLELRDELQEALGKLWDELRDRSIEAIVVPIGYQMIMNFLVLDTENHGYVSVRPPPFHLDSELRMPEPRDRPASFVHQCVAEGLLVALGERGILADLEELPLEVTERARDIERFYKRSLGKDDSLRRFVKTVIPAITIFDDPEERPWVFHGVGDDGRSNGEESLEIVLKLDPSAERRSLSLEFELRRDRPFPEQLEIFWPAPDLFKIEPYKLKVRGRQIEKEAIAGNSRVVRFRFEIPPYSRLISFMCFRLILPEMARESGFRLRRAAYHAD